MFSAGAYKLSESDNPVDEMLKQIGDLDKIDVAGARVLMWIYIRPRKTKGGIILTDKEIKEDIWQGTIGYVLKLGPLAFRDDREQHLTFGGFSVKKGDWVVFSTGDAPRRTQINGIDCRFIEDSLIQAVIDSPDRITHRQ